MFLTDEGQVVYNSAKEILEKTDALIETFAPREETLEDDHNIEGPLNIVASLSMSTMLYSLLETFIRKYPRTHTSYTEQDSGRIFWLIKEGLPPVSQADLILATISETRLEELDPFLDRYDIYVLSSERSCLLASTRSPLAKQQRISLKTLSTLPIVGFASPSFDSEQHPALIADSFRDYGIKLNVVLTSNSYHSWYRYISDGIAYGLVGNYFMKNYSEDHHGRSATTVTIPLKEKIVAVNLMLIPRKNELSPQCKKFIELTFNRYKQSMRKL